MRINSYVIAQKIKQSLIERAQIKKNYAKLKKQGKIPDEPENAPTPAASAELQAPTEANPPPHPDRQVLIDQEVEDPSPEDQVEVAQEGGYRQRKKRPKTVPFQKEYEHAQRRKAEMEERQKAYREAEQERQSKIAERERFRKAMAKARTGGPNGQRKLGRESKVLLEKVKRMTGGE